MTDEAVAAVAQAPANETISPADTKDTAPAPVTIVEKKEPTMDETLRAAYDKATKPRDEKGKFKVSDASAEPATEADPELPLDEAATEPESTDQPEIAKAEPAKPAIDPPHSWSGEHKAMWTDAPPSEAQWRQMQTYIVQREADAHKAITRAGEFLKQYEPFDQLINANSQKFIKRGITPAQSFAALLAAQDSLDENPVGGLVQIAASYGIDLRPYLQGAQQQGGQPQADPVIAQLRAELGELKGKMTAKERAEVEAEQLAQQQHIAQASVAIADFAKNKPYFEEVRPLMAVFLSPPMEGMKPAANTLDEAYDMAVNAKPDIRQRIQADQRKAEEAKRLADQKAKADAAKKAAATNVKSGPSTQSPKTMDDTLSEIARRHYG